MTITFTGQRGVQTFRAIALRHGLQLYAKTRIKPNRAWTPTAMLRAAGEITGRTYGRGHYLAAAADLNNWIAQNGATS
jgi:hypothetical protein